MVDSALLESEKVFARFETSRDGLTSEVAAERRAQHGPNVLAKDQRVAWSTLIWHSELNPLVILLGVLAAISFTTGDMIPAAVRILVVTWC